MRRNELERRLSMVPPHPAPVAALEQYATPAAAAAEMLYEVLARGDLEGKAIIDLGCGTGVLAIGAKLLGAGEVVGIDIDAGSVAIAHTTAERMGMDIDFIVGDVRMLQERADVVVMNPPFGAQVRNADRPFVEAALRLAPVVYSLHNAGTIGFLRKLAKALNSELVVVKGLTLSLPHQFPHHRKAVVEHEVALVRWERDGAAPLGQRHVNGSRSSDG